MGDADDHDPSSLVVDLVDDAPIADAEPIVVAAGELRSPLLPRLS